MTTPPPPPPPPPRSRLPPLPPPPPPPMVSPPPLSTYKFKIENREVKTTVVAAELHLSSCLSDFLSYISADRQIKRIVGLDIQIVYASIPDPSSKVAVLKLCAGRRCLVIQLLHFKSIPSSLACFLDLPDLSFVGVGINRCLAALERDYGLGCRNAVDLGQLVAKVRDKPYLTAFGLVDLANEVGLLNVSVKPPSVALSNWGTSSLTSDQTTRAITLERRMEEIRRGNILRLSACEDQALAHLHRDGTEKELPLLPTQF
ncbi:hypothetical protein V2J09_015677 [Rumex salicifolius]